MQREEVREEVPERPPGILWLRGGVDEADRALKGDEPSKMRTRDGGVNNLVNWDVSEEGRVLLHGRNGGLAVLGAHEEEGTEGGVKLGVDCRKLHRFRYEYGKYTPTNRGTHHVLAKGFLCAGPLAIDIPSGLGRESRERKPVVILVLLEVGEGNEEEA